MGHIELTYNLQTLAVMIVTDHPIMRDGLRLLIQQEADMEVVCETADRSRIGTDFMRCKPDITLVDLQIPRGAALTAVSTIHRISRQAGIVLLTMFPDEPDAALRIEDGHILNVPRTASGGEIIAAIRNAARLGPPS